MTEGRPLDGLVVADLSRVLAGPTAAVMLADLGARVIKVERPGTGDDTRQWGPPWAGSSSSYFESANRSKQSIALDFGDADDLRIARALVDRADIVIENYRAGALERHGLDAAAVARAEPARRLRLHHGIRQRSRSRAAGLRLPGAGGRRAR